MQRLANLSIFFPALNDAHTLPRLIKRAKNAAKRVTDDAEIIIVNDGSTDATADVLKKQRGITVITHTTNKGYGAALRSGFAAATKDWVFYTDGDGQYDPLQLVMLVGALTPTTDVVNGYKVKRADNMLRRSIGSIYAAAMRAVFSLPVRDVDCDFRLIRRAKLPALTKSSGAICIELILGLKKNRARFAEVPVSHYPRRFGKSQFFRLKHIVRTVLEFL